MPDRKFTPTGDKPFENGMNSMRFFASLFYIPRGRVGQKFGRELIRLEVGVFSKDENEGSLQGKLTDGTVVVIEAGASFYTDPSSDVRQMHMSVVKCSN
ncbi:hypothetical protein TNCV_653541 [Trichonephila clavipes]|nr:hypothetical protein TNCV_653541 [Trichonephila clavipes]